MKAAVALTAGLVLMTTAACGSSSTTSESTEKKGGDFIYLDAEIPVSFQLQTGGTFWQTTAIVNQILDRLVYVDSTGGDIRPWLAESWDISDDGLNYTFTIRKGVTFSDGTPLDLANVKRNLDRNAFGDEPKGIPKQVLFPEVTEIVTDEAAHTVTITLAEPRPFFLRQLSEQNFGFAANKTLDLSKEAQGSVLNLIGTGPFVAVKETPGKEIVLERRAGYAWPPAGAENTGEAYLDSVTFIPILEDSVRLGALRSQQGDALRYVQPSEEDPLLNAGFQIFEGVNTASGLALRPNSTPALNDVRVRRALLIGLNRQEWIDSILTERWSAARGLAPDTSPFFVDQSGQFPFDPDEADRLLDEAGWSQRNADSIRTKDGSDLTLDVYVDVYSNISPTLYQLIQQQWGARGVHLNLKQVDYSKFPTAVAEDTSLEVVAGNGPAPLDPVNLFNLYHSSKSDTLKLEGADPKLDELLAAQLGTADAAAAADAVKEISKYLVEQAYVIPTIDNSQLVVAQSYVHGVTFNGTTRPNFHGVWVSQK
ncbi:ABC transporter substrate-binding protein [Mycobacterium sp. C31M]